MARGDDIDQIPNLKEYLAMQVKSFKQKKHLKEISYGIKTTKYDRGGNNSNKFYAFTEMEDGGNISDWEWHFYLSS